PRIEACHPGAGAGYGRPHPGPAVIWTRRSWQPLFRPLMCLPLNPSPVMVEQKWGMEGKDYLVLADGCKNMHLLNKEEYIDGALSGHLGKVFIRGNSVLYLSSEREEDGEMRE
uniref:Sm domain-containing protein n=1 Tax=Salvator merianae TaxID=96440 RepID=A0A8D0ED16_SALMN